MTSFLTDLLQAQIKRINTPHKGLIKMEWAALVYLTLTTLLIGVLHAQMNYPLSMLIGRVNILLITVCLIWIYKLYPCRLSLLVRIAFQLGLLAYWYPDTYEFNRLFPNMDHWFATLEQDLFGCQPAIEFSRHLSGKFWSEAFNLGYWAYYPMIGVVIFFYYFCRPNRFERISFIVICSFFLYYLIYIFLPVAGPQYYYPAIGYPEVNLYQLAQNHFPAIGDYFNHHAELLPAPGDPDGFFFQRVADAQAAGERPTAAFPSSHVGVSTILMILAWKGKRTLFLCLLPFYTLLCCATVYIQAHYLIDALAGFVTAFGAYFAASWIERKSDHFLAYPPF